VKKLSRSEEMYDWGVYCTMAKLFLGYRKSELDFYLFLFINHVERNRKCCENEIYTYIKLRLWIQSRNSIKSSQAIWSDIIRTVFHISRCMFYLGSGDFGRHMM